ncbi:hypothetical protein VST7929_01729 [Vibrio stylophorae]|uniref:DUF2989 domain-containing protein n=1 Tax=Vibrio stylophorae TaxID=659351 RepID=A0ABM8ZUI2_9VIBR|nr:DUF2989 domain-containing protein [Vibrio stylophorae]CAH0533853.1 hypothetical protein VST7929_01729 [Vibrio stylophorae]
MRRLFTPLALVLLLSGCWDRHTSTTELCEDKPYLCQGTNKGDGQCRVQRTRFIWQKYEVEKDASDAQKFKLLTQAQHYYDCLTLAARIEPTELKERKTLRADAAMFAQDEILRLEQELASSSNPDVLYYFWGKGSYQALEQFLALEGQTVMNTPDLQLKLASYYIERDLEHTLKILSYGLSLYQAGDTVNPELLSALATVSHRSGYKDNAYIWSLVAQHYGVAIASEKQLTLLYPMNADHRTLLKHQADQVTDALKEGRYRSQMVPIPSSENAAFSE